GCRQRLEKKAIRSMAQSGALTRIQLDGEHADRCVASRSQLRDEVLPPRDLRRSSLVWRASPIRSCLGFGARLEGRRNRYQSSGSPVRTIEVWRKADFQGILGPNDRYVSHGIRP